MPKCWIHGNFLDKKEETKKKSTSKKNLDWPDRSKDFQQNLALILSPAPKEQHIKTYRWYDFQVLTEKQEKLEAAIKNKDKDLELQANSIEQLEAELDLKEEKCHNLKDEKDYLEITLETLNDNIISLNETITKKDDQLAKNRKIIEKNISLLKEHKQKIEDQEALLNKEKKSVGTQTDPYVDKHLTADVQRLEREKQELDAQIKELEKEEKNSKTIRDQELQELNEKVAKQAQTIKDLTEVRMKREESEERLRKQSEDFLQVQQMNQTVYDILGQFSQQNGLLPRAQAVILELNKTRQDLANANKQVSLWTTNYNTANSQLSLWTSAFPKENASQVQTRVNYSITQASQWQTNYNNANNRANNLQTQLNTANTELAKEKGWWDKWLSLNKTMSYGKGFILTHSQISQWGLIPFAETAYDFDNSYDLYGELRINVKKLVMNLPTSNVEVKIYADGGSGKGDIRKYIKAIYHYCRDKQTLELR